MSQLQLDFEKPPAPPAAAAPVLLLKRHPRARRYLLRVDDDGTVRVTIPRWGSQREARAFAEREARWIAKQLARRRRQEGQEGRNGQDGRDAILSRAKSELPARLRELAAQLGFAADRIRKISVRNQKWRWGSCSPDGHICLNWRLAAIPAPVRDYVMIHELMHLKRMDHSPKFWRLVARACPDYRERRRQLRELSFSSLG